MSVTLDRYMGRNNRKFRTDKFVRNFPNISAHVSEVIEACCTVYSFLARGDVSTAAEVTHEMYV